MFSWRSIRETVLSVVMVLGISVVVWYLVDKELMAHQEISVPLTIRFERSSDRAQWLELDKYPVTLGVVFTGPREKIEELRRKQRSLQANYTLVTTDLPQGGDVVTVRHVLRLDQLRIEFADGAIPEGVSLTIQALSTGSGGDDGGTSSVSESDERRSTAFVLLARTDVHEVSLKAAATAVIGESFDAEVDVSEITPELDEIYAVVPRTVVDFDLAAMFVSKPLVDDATKDEWSIQFAFNRGPNDVIHYFEDEDRTREVTSMDIEFVIKHVNLVNIKVPDVSVNWQLTPIFVERGVMILSLPKGDVIDITVSAPEVFESEKHRFSVVLVGDETGVVWSHLENAGDINSAQSFHYELAIYRLLELVARGLPVHLITLVDPPPSRTISVDLIKR